MTQSRRISFGLLAGLFLAVQAAALTHELNHVLHQHDNPSCALHLYAENPGKASAADCSFAIGVVHDTPTVPPQTIFVSLERALGYHVRAPPHSSSSIV
jgi:hypothetical protein